MSDDDLIRRGDALDVFTDWALGPEEAIAKFRALPAATGWQDISTAPKDGTHMIVAIETPGGFVRSVEGAFMGGQWMNALDLNVEPLCWMHKSLIPGQFLPWNKPTSPDAGEEN